MNLQRTLSLSGMALVCGLGAWPVQAYVPAGYQWVANQYQVPEQVFYGIALQESGQKLSRSELRPWPWTLNVEGKSYVYPTRKACWQALMGFLHQGKRLIDVGLMQVNWHFHHDKLGSTWQALDPYFNLQVGAKILRNEYVLTHDWFQAVGRYHSPGQRPEQKQRAYRYAAGVVQRIQRYALR